jgi:rhodanese-related sulfurtransferase
MAREIDRSDVRRLVRTGAQVVEVLEREEFDREHIRDALNIPIREIDDRALAELDPDRAVIVYCLDPT